MSQRTLCLCFILLLTCVTLGATMGTAQAAGLKGKASVSPRDGWNPKPAAADLVLPMPCDLNMVFMPVELATRGFLRDVDFNMGSDLSDRPGMEYYDRRFAQSISAPFTKSDMPKEWAKNLSASAQYYLIGKYEISMLQWQAIMNASCPGEPQDADLQPKADISWHEAVDFSRRYMEWLLQHKPDSIPRFNKDSKNIGYVRLPTEAEWEYAARGGNSVSPDVLRQQEFYPLEAGATLEEYAAYRPENAAKILDRPQRIGSRRANPLGLYDMAGNVAEMMQDSFYFSLGNRLHGSAGGIVRKGGSFSSSQEGILPGRRDEMALFTERGPARSRDTGFRLVLSGINTPEGSRTDALKKEWAALGEHNDTITQGANPLQEIDRIAELTRDSAAKENLTILRGVIKDFNIALEREKDAAVEGLLRSSVYMLETIRNYAVRLNLSHERLVLHKEELAKMSDTGSKVYATRKQMITNYEEVAAMFVEAIDASILFYKGRLVDLAAIDATSYDHYEKLLNGEFSGKGIFKTNMTKNIATIGAHRAKARQGKRAELSLQHLRDDILPENLRLHLPKQP